MSEPPARAPCSLRCPAGIDAPRYVRLIAEGRFAEAAAVIRNTTPFALTLGYACSGPCEETCNRAGLDDPLAVRALKRFACERAPAGNGTRPRPVAATGRRVAVVGSGPGGLTAAWTLARRGHEVTVFERMAEPGGMLRYGIPEFRLPRRVVDEEIREVERAGVRIRTRHAVRSREDLFRAGFDAVLLAVGLPHANIPDLPGLELHGVLSGLAFLQAVNEGFPPRIGRNVLVVGGGNVAVDVARCTLRLGARATLVCLEPRDGMPAFAQEVTDGEEEGLRIVAGWGPRAVLGEGGHVAGLEVARCMALLDDRGRFRPRLDDLSTSRIPADTVLLAVGQRADSSLLRGLRRRADGRVAVDTDTHRTSDQRVFECGDVVPRSGSVIDAIAGARRAAAAIDRRLGGTGDRDEIPGTATTLATGRVGRRIPTVSARGAAAVPPPATAERARLRIRCLPGAARIHGFRPVELGLAPEAARAEAARCLRCYRVLRFDAERCVLCGKCEDRCAFDALAWHPGPDGVWSLTVRDDLCRRCGDCLEACPPGALAWEGDGWIAAAS